MCIAHFPTLFGNSPECAATRRQNNSYYFVLLFFLIIVTSYMKDALFTAFHQQFKCFNHECQMPIAQSVFKQTVLNVFNVLLS